MARIKYYYDTDTCKYERIRLSKMDIFLNSLGIFFAILICSFVIVLIAKKFFPTPAEQELREENAKLKYHNKIHRENIDQLKKIADNLESRDNSIYRVIFEAERDDSNNFANAIGGVERNNVVMNFESNEKMIRETSREIERLKRRMYQQSLSYDELYNLAQNKEDMLAHMPGIQPVSDKNGKRFSSGFGIRIHPILKIRKKHNGVDFAAKKGTPIYATGNGKVIQLKNSAGGFGKIVVIDHGYGFKTRYAHMSKFGVKRGQNVKRGDIIGYVGSSGRSTAPHVHYEVLKNNIPVNPVNYFTYGLTSEQYERILKKSAVENQSLE